MFITMKIATRLILGIALAGAAACNGATEASTGPGGGEQPGDDGSPANISGTFRLATHDGNPLPALVWYDNTAEGIDAEMWIESGSIVLRPDSSYTQSDLSRLVIEGVSEQTRNSQTAGTYSFDPYDPGADYGTLVFRGENGGQSTCDLTQISITCRASVPGPAGGMDIPVVLVYVRE
jgi:hypothetical protein